MVLCRKDVRISRVRWIEILSRRAGTQNDIHKVFYKADNRKITLHIPPWVWLSNRQPCHTLKNQHDKAKEPGTIEVRPGWDGEDFLASKLLAA